MKDKDYTFEPLAMALGFFDGIHLGHQELVKEANQSAEQNEYKSSVMSFKTHPLSEIFPSYTPKLIMENHEKVDRLKELEIDYVFLEDFNEDLMKLEPEEFIRDFLLKKYNIKILIVGFNYSFGYKGHGDTETLKELGEKYGFEVKTIDPLIVKDDIVSSTRIRELLQQGKITEVNELIGKPYKITGTIQSGKQLGRQYNIPTANLKTNSNKILPQSGVYFTNIYIDGKKYDGLTNLGYNPTFIDHPYSIETYIYDFNDNIYGKEVELEFLHKIRDEKKFSGLDELFSQIHSDIKKADALYRH